MKAFPILAALSLFLFAVSSCGQCTECTNYPKKDIKLCKKDFASDDSYTAAFRYTQSLGYDCN